MSPGGDNQQLQCCLLFIKGGVEAGENTLFKNMHDEKLKKKKVSAQPGTIQPSITCSKDFNTVSKTLAGQNWNLTEPAAVPEYLIT